jgi:RecB family exonuclease
MKITNRHGLPETFVNILKRPKYNNGGADRSVTQLINSPKIVALQNAHRDELEEDVSDRVFSIFGSAIHSVLEHGKDEFHTVEQRLHMDIDGWHLSGAVDLQITNPDSSISIRDYKVTSAWSVMNAKSDWANQLNVLAHLVESVNGAPVKDLGIVAIIRDWSRRDAANREGYPQSPVCEIPIRLWDAKEREEYIKDRISAHSAVEFAMSAGESLPECTPEEMWEKSTIFAVRKIGGVRAKSLHKTEAEANEALASLGKGYEIDVRPGERTRCAHFCPVSSHCSQWHNFNKE